MNETNVIDTSRSREFAALAREFNVPATRLRQWARTGKLDAYRLGGRWYAQPEDVLAQITFSRHQAQGRRHR